MPKRHVSWTALAALVAIAIGIVLSYAIHWFPVQASTQAHNTDTLYHVLVIASIPIFVLVVTVILYCVWRFRMKPGEELKDGPPIHGNTRLEVIWTTIPALLLLGPRLLLVRGAARKREEAGTRDPGGSRPASSSSGPSSIRPRSPAESRSRATSCTCPRANRWSSTCAPRTSSTRSGFPRSASRRTWCRGSPPTGARRPTGIGSYPVVCNLLCGVGHSTMRSTVHVVTPSERFKAWLKSQLAAPTPVASATTGSRGRARAPGLEIRGLRMMCRS